MIEDTLVGYRVVFGKSCICDLRGGTNIEGDRLRIKKVRLF
jgi:hypothetical protein